jgi:hypothetical protein
MVAIYSTLGLSSTLAGALRDTGLIEEFFWRSLILLGSAILIMGLKARPSGATIGLALGIAGAYLLAFLRMGSPEERTHLFEYTIVALLIHEALTERAHQGNHVPRPALLAILITILLGWMDEGIQALLPNRVYDIRDVGFNALAAVMAVGGSLLLSWVRRRFD